MSNLQSDRITINDCQIRAVRETFTSTTKTITVVVANYHSCYVDFMALRTLGSDNIAYWHGFLNNNYSTGYAHALDFEAGDGNLALTFTNVGSGTYTFGLDSSGSSATFTMYLYQMTSSVPSISVS